MIDKFYVDSRIGLKIIMYNVYSTKDFYLLPFDMNKENVLEPIMIHNMKHENIIPKGGDVVADGEVRTGVHKNTKIYIQDSIIL